VAGVHGVKGGLRFDRASAFAFLNRIDHFGTFFAPPGAKNRAIRSTLLAAPKGFPLLSLVPHGRITGFYDCVSSIIGVYNSIVFCSVFT
jgi:hypothetical protein